MKRNSRKATKNPEPLRYLVFIRGTATGYSVDVPDLPEHRAFLKNFKGILKERFRQIDMWITSYPVDII